MNASQYWLWLGLITLAVGAPSFAEEITSMEHQAHSDQEGLEHVHGTHPECPLPRTAQDLVECAQENHPNVRRAVLGKDQSTLLEGAARQIPNPELETQAVFGRTLGDQQMQTQISLVQPLEIGGQRGARIRGAQARHKQSEADVSEIKARVTVETIINLHRLRQVESEKHVLEEAIQSFVKLIAQHRSRPVLAPEQEVSLGVYEMAKSDYTLRLSTLLEEEEKLSHYFHITTGHSKKEILVVLPKTPEKWPTLAEHAPPTAISPSIFRLRADREFSLSELDTAKASSWPDLRIGPMIQLQADGAFRSQLYGFQLNFTLPVFNLNGGGRAHAAKGVAVADGLIDVQRQFERHERAELVRVYSKAVEALKEVLAPESVQRRHQRAEALAFRGLVSSALVIETHRQILDLEKSKNERELRAIEALWEVHTLDGRVFEEKL